MLIPILAKVIDALNRIGKSTDTASATGTLHAKVTDAKNSVGNTGDAASSTGSVHAKIANVQNTVNAIPTNTQRQIGMTKQSGTTTSASTVTIVSVSGVGRLNLLTLAVSGGTSPSSYITSVKVDGVEILSSLYNGSMSMGGTTTVESPQTPPWNANSYDKSWDVYFKSSLVIQGYVTGGATLTVNAYTEM